MLDLNVSHKEPRRPPSIALMGFAMGFLLSGAVSLGSCAGAVPEGSNQAQVTSTQGALTKASRLDSEKGDVREIQTAPGTPSTSLGKIRAQCAEKHASGEELPFEPSYYPTLRSLLARSLISQSMSQLLPKVSQSEAHQNALNAIADWVEQITGDRKKLDEAWAKVSSVSKESSLNYQLVEYLMLFGVDSNHHECEAWLSTLAFTGYVQSFIPGATFEKDSDVVEEGYDYVTKEIPKTKEKVRLKIPRAL